MTFIAELAEKRRKLLDGLRANEGDINLRIFEDFYPDEAHFIYELLQNAEDAGASEASFELTPDGCAFVHNGPRHFDENDIRAITGIFNSSKKGNPDKIGKFGVGFKSVFVYTETPIIYSKLHSFRISQLVLPEAVAPKKGLGEYTRFEFPFNNTKKSAAQAFVEVKAGLEALSERTLLFLNNLCSIAWSTGSSQGAALRIEHSPFHVEVLKEVGSRKAMSSHWLRFSAPVEGLERQRVAIAFELEALAEEKDFEPRKPLARQMKIVPAERGQVSVFFPAEKETSGLRFHLHAPFVPELSRASIKNSPANAPLFAQLATLTARSLHEVKSLGLLSGEFLAVLPNHEDAIEERYQAIRDSIIAAMQKQPLTPTHGKGHAPAKSLLQARASLKELLTNEDLQFLLSRDDYPTWAIGAIRNSRQDRFLSSLSVEVWDADKLAELLGERAYDGEYWGSVDNEVMAWLAAKTDEWHQQLYAVLYKLLEDDDDFSVLNDTKIVRLSDGSYSRAEDVYFPSDQSDPSDPFPRVSASILTVGSRKTQQADARKLLEKLGVREVGEAEEISLLLSKRYAEESKPPSDKVYLADLKRFIRFLEKNPGESEQFKNAYIFRVDSEAVQWCTAEWLYLDRPFKETGLAAYHEAMAASERERYPLSRWYLECGVELGRFVAIAELVGCSATLAEFIVPTSCVDNPRWEYLASVPGERASSPIDRDYSMTQAAYDLLQTGNAEVARLVWRTMCTSGSTYLQAQFRMNASNGSRVAPSRLVHLLSEAAWVPQKDGQFVTPRRASRDGLLKGFTFDAGYKWLQLVHFGEDERTTAAEQAERAKKRADLGFENDEDLLRAQAFVKLPREEQERILAEYIAEADLKEEFPARTVRNRDLRNRRLRDEAAQTPNKESQTRGRVVAIGYDAVKSAARLYLQEQYTNENGVMFCQACQAALPFRLLSGGYYFEAVEAVGGLPKRFQEAFLSLCPNHAAMFLHANEQKDDIRELIEVAARLEIEVTLGGEASTIRFTETHLADIRACLASLDENRMDESA